MTIVALTVETRLTWKTIAALTVETRFSWMTIVALTVETRLTWMTIVALTVETRLLPQSHTHLRTLTESLGSNRRRPQKNEGGALFLGAFARRSYL